MNKNELLNIYLKNDGIPRNLLQLARALGFRVVMTEYHDKDKKNDPERLLAYTIIAKEKAIINIYQNEDKDEELFMLAYQIAEYILLPRKYGVRGNSSTSLKPEICDLARRMINRQKLYKNNGNEVNKSK